MKHTIGNYEDASDQKKLKCLTLYQFAMQNNLRSFKMVIADNKYYEKTLQQRRDILGAPSINFLSYDPKFQGPYYPKYFAVVVQYISKIHTQKLNKVMKTRQQENSTVKASKQYFHFRLADDQISSQLTGYQHNAVIPIQMKTKYQSINPRMPIIISQTIQYLKPACFWMGGGHPDLKMRISFQQFIRINHNDVIVQNITYDNQ